MVPTMCSPFVAFFHDATGRAPYPYQERFATADGWPHLLRAPTGAGKTATAVLGWLYRWREQCPDTPRRLVYCLPMRVLVEQSFGEALRWLHRLHLLDAPDGFDPDDPAQVRAYRPRLDASTSGKIAVHRLMGGVEAEAWYLHPERPAILLGTQDMLLSRALNRGYAASRFHWPIDFGLLHNDALWVFDEPQLMGSGVSTSAQLAGLRQTLGTFGPCPSVWMSATLEPRWLDTIDFRGKFPGPPLELQAEDYAEPRLCRRMTAAKTLHPLGSRLTKEADEKELAAVAAAIREKHQPGTQTLVVVNTVKRAVGVFRALKKLGQRNLLLVHSRFRPHERDELNRQVQERGDSARDRILVATQVVEAGVDLSARTLVTELAPWASLVQRMGRCNRTGDDGPGAVYWIDLDEAKLAAPYEADELMHARELLAQLDGGDVSPRALACFNQEKGMTLPFIHRHVLRRRDLLGLFDTAPDLSGNDIDIQQYVRGDDPDSDVQVFWRRFDGPHPSPDEPRPRRVELCNVPVGQMRAFLTAGQHAFVWDHLDGEWVRLPREQLRPGLTLLLHPAQGGYDTGEGWTGDAKSRVAPVEGSAAPPEEATDADPNSQTPLPRTLAEHTEAVYQAVGRIASALPWLSDDLRRQLLLAARWHDIGKAHPLFQEAVRRLGGLAADRLWAKSGGQGRLYYGRKHFRHELASALAILQHHPDWPFLVAYLAAAHHGKVRLSIRSLPGEEPPREDPSRPFALGLVHGETLLPFTLDGETYGPTVLDLTPMLLGHANSWTARTLALRDDRDLGPFRLAGLEAILRAADQWVSNRERQEKEPCP